MSLFSLLPDTEILLGLEPEELAGFVLEDLCKSQSRQESCYNYTLLSNFQDYPEELQERVAQAVSEAWAWLEREGLLAPMPGTIGDWRFITRRGRQLQNAQNLQAYRHENKLPKGLLHPVLAQRVYPLFLRGDYDTAVFQAFKQVEVNVRKQGGYNAQDLGVELMRKAFHPETGPLTDKGFPKSEIEAKCHLYAGAIGLYKNPSSHRNVTFSPERAVEIIMIASHLLNLLDESQNNSTSSS